MAPSPANHALSDDDAIDLAELFARLRRGAAATLGLALIGLAIAALAFVLASPFRNVTTTTRVVFSFPGFERGEYPDKSKFSPDDIRSPEIVAEALKRQGLGTDEAQGRVRAALTIEGIIPDTVAKERDKQRSAGQLPRVYIPDEYSLTLTLPRKFPLSYEQRVQLLNEIVSIYRTKFTRTYGAPPLEFGSAFETLKDADFFEYELILNMELQNIVAFLNQQLNSPQNDNQAGSGSAARTFRSQTTNLSFTDLIKQAQLFSQIKLTETLGLIRQHGLSKNRAVAMVKMNYYLRVLEDQEQKALEEEKLVQDLLGKTRERGESYVLGVKSQAVQTQPGTPLLDQGLINSLLANDAYNFLVREALQVGLKVKAVQAEKAVLIERRRNMEAFIQGDASDQSLVVAQMRESLISVEAAYRTLVQNIRQTYEDYVKQQFADSIRVSLPAQQDSYYRSLAMAGLAGLAIGGALGLGLSLLGVGFARAKVP